MDSEAEAALLRTMDAFNERVAARDLEGTLQMLANDSEVAVLGSEHGELALGGDGVGTFFGRIYRRPVAYSWDWRRRWVSVRGSVAWVLAEGDVLATRAGSVTRSPSRFTAVLEQRDGSWLFLQIHHSEPAAAPE